MRTFILAALVLSGVVSDASGQDRGDERAVAVAAVDAMLDDRDRSDVILSSATHARVRAHEIAAMVGAEARERAALIVCSDAVPPFCRVADGRTAIILGEMEIGTDHATVWVGVVSEVGSGQLYHEAWLVRLNRLNSGWEVVKKELVLVT